MIKIKKDIKFGEHVLSFDIGRMACQADASVLVTLGGTSVLCTVVSNPHLKEGIDFFPLSVHYQEKAFAAGKIPGGFIKREGKPSDRETLISRLIDRPIRPLFPDFFMQETQIICTVLSYDPECDSDIIAILGASCALSISNLPFMGPVGAVKVGYKDGHYILNPTTPTDLDLVVAGTKEGILMVESRADQLDEHIMMGALQFGFQAFQPVINLIQDISNMVNPSKIQVKPFPYYQDSVNFINANCKKDVESSYTIKIKKERYGALSKIADTAFDTFQQQMPVSKSVFNMAFDHVKSSILRGHILKEGRRLDGRSLTDIRPLTSDVGLFERVHGTAVFERGETQVFAATTLGSPADMQTQDGLNGEYKERFMLHYNFPPYSVGEVGRFGAPGRREIGHGYLAHRALLGVMPKISEFPYTVRVVSEVLSCNGSSSMATVCGASLSLMNAGVPISSHVAGIAMGLVQEEGVHCVLSDIIGDEDHLGDMDFKVAGTSRGITALQMDIKITSLSFEVIEKALAQAKEGRLHILKHMNETLSEPKQHISTFAPAIKTITIPKAKIRDVIGSGGKTIREMCDRFQAKIDISEEGFVTITSPSTLINQVVTTIQNITTDPEIGKIYSGKVTKILDFGAIVAFLGTEGMVHISQIADFRVNEVSDVLKIGQEVTVKVLEIEQKGRIRLSMKINKSAPPAVELF